MITTEVTTTTAPFNYAGEAFLSTSIPDYPLERILLILRIIFAFVAWLVLFPMLTMKRTTKPLKSTPSSSTTTTTTTKIGIKEKSSSSSSKRRGGKKGGKQTFKNDKIIKPQNEDTNTNEEVVVISDVMNFICITGFLVTLCYLLIMVSPDNTFPTRTVFEAPLFTREECHEWIRRSEQAARRNYDMAKQQQEQQQTNNNSDSSSSSLSFLEEPIGWQKKRHQKYSTTDLNVVTDPFSKEDRQWLKEKLDARLAPTIQRVYGVPIGSIRANDIFVIRYDSDRQAALEPHTDDGDVTFSVLLSEGFSGGGTNYYDRSPQHSSTPKSPQVFAHVLPEIGQMTLFRAPTLHEGVQVEEGRRYLLIGFLSVDNVDPFSNQKPTGLSWFASWFSLDWAGVRFKAGYEAASRSHASASKPKQPTYNEESMIRGLFKYIHNTLTIGADLVGRHVFQRIVPTDQTYPFLEALDEAHKNSDLTEEPSWFAGQQVSLSIGGTKDDEWDTRRDNAALFDQSVL